MGNRLHLTDHRGNAVTVFRVIAKIGMQIYRSIFTGRERGKNTKLVFGTVRLDLTKILRRQENG